MARQCCGRHLCTTPAPLTPLGIGSSLWPCLSSWTHGRQQQRQQQAAAVAAVVALACLSPALQVASMRAMRCPWQSLIHRQSGSLCSWGKPRWVALGRKSVQHLCNSSAHIQGMTPALSSTALSFSHQQWAIICNGTTASRVAACATVHAAAAAGCGWTRLHSALLIDACGLCFCVVAGFLADAAAAAKRPCQVAGVAVAQGPEQQGERAVDSAVAQIHKASAEATATQHIWAAGSCAARCWGAAGTAGGTCCGG